MPGENSMKLSLVCVYYKKKEKKECSLHVNISLVDGSSLN